MNNITEGCEKPVIFVCQTQCGSAAFSCFFQRLRFIPSPPDVYVQTYTHRGLAPMIKEGSQQQLPGSDVETWV